MTEGHAMHQPSRRSVLQLLAAAPTAGLLSKPGVADASPIGPPKDLSPGGAFDRFIAEQAAADRFSGTVMVAHRGRPILTRSFGMANKKLSIPNGADTIFDLESITKTFTAVAMARLVQQGKVGLYEKLGTYLDGFPAEIADTVTVHQLLTHTSGLGVHGNDFSDTKEFAEERLTWRSGQEVMDGVLAIIRKEKLVFTPGTMNGYSNSGMFVVGAIVERVSGRSYYDYVREHVFAPAGMRSTDFYTRPQVRRNYRIAHDYLTDQTGGHTDFTDSEDFGFIGTPVNGAYSTVADLVRFARALQNGTLLAPAFSTLITTGKAALSPSDAPPDPDPHRFYGYGFRVSIRNNHGIFGHSGSGAGTTTNLDIYPDLDWVSAILCNYSAGFNTPSLLTPIVDLERQLISTWH